tara:strand:+ start:371 stop:595 length:225 start_codon:yes stop_codon:yes gene_type:complete
MRKTNKTLEHKKKLKEMMKTQEIVVTGDKIQGRTWELDVIDSSNAMKYFLEGDVEMADKISNHLLQLYEWRTKR